MAKSSDAELYLDTNSCASQTEDDLGPLDPGLTECITLLKSSPEFRELTYRLQRSCSGMTTLTITRDRMAGLLGGMLDPVSLSLTPSGLCFLSVLFRPLTLTDLKMLPDTAHLDLAAFRDLLHKLNGQAGYGFCPGFQREDFPPGLHLQSQGFQVLEQPCRRVQAESCPVFWQLRPASSCPGELGVQVCASCMKSVGDLYVSLKRKDEDVSSPVFVQLLSSGCPPDYVSNGSVSSTQAVKLESERSVLSQNSFNSVDAVLVKRDIVEDTTSSSSLAESVEQRASIVTCESTDSDMTCKEESSDRSNVQQRVTQDNLDKVCGFDSTKKQGSEVSGKTVVNTTTTTSTRITTTANNTITTTTATIPEERTATVTCKSPSLSQEDELCPTLPPAHTTGPFKTTVSELASVTDTSMTTSMTDVTNSTSASSDDVMNVTTPAPDDVRISMTTTPPRGGIPLEPTVVEVAAFSATSQSTSSTDTACSSIAACRPAPICDDKAGCSAIAAPEQESSTSQDMCWKRKGASKRSLCPESAERVGIAEDTDSGLSPAVPDEPERKKTCYRCPVCHKPFLSHSIRHRHIVNDHPSYDSSCTTDISSGLGDVDKPVPEQKSRQTSSYTYPVCDCAPRQNRKLRKHRANVNIKKSHVYNQCWKKFPVRKDVGNCMRKYKDSVSTAHQNHSIILSKKKPLGTHLRQRKSNHPQLRHVFSKLHSQQTGIDEGESQSKVREKRVVGRRQKVVHGILNKVKKCLKKKAQRCEQMVSVSPVFKNSLSCQWSTPCDTSSLPVQLPADCSVRPSSPHSPLPRTDVKEEPPQQKWSDSQLLCNTPSHDHRNVNKLCISTTKEECTSGLEKDLAVDMSSPKSPQRILHSQHLSNTHPSKDTNEIRCNQSNVIRHRSTTDLRHGDGKNDDTTDIRRRDTNNVADTTDNPNANNDTKHSNTSQLSSTHTGDGKKPDVTSDNRHSDISYVRSFDIDNGRNCSNFQPNDMSGVKPCDFNNDITHSIPSDFKNTSTGDVTGTSDVRDNDDRENQLTDKERALQRKEQDLQRREAALSRQSQLIQQLVLEWQSSLLPDTAHSPNTSAEGSTLSPHTVMAMYSSLSRAARRKQNGQHRASTFRRITPGTSPRTTVPFSGAQVKDWGELGQIGHREMVWRTGRELLARAAQLKDSHTDHFPADMKDGFASSGGSLVSPSTSADSASNRCSLSLSASSSNESSPSPVSHSAWRSPPNTPHAACSSTQKKFQLSLFPPIENHFLQEVMKLAPLLPKSAREFLPNQESKQSSSVQPYRVPAPATAARKAASQMAKTSHGWTSGTQQTKSVSLSGGRMRENQSYLQEKLLSHPVRVSAEEVDRLLALVKKNVTPCVTSKDSKSASCVFLGNSSPSSGSVACKRSNRTSQDTETAMVPSPLPQRSSGDMVSRTSPLTSQKTPVSTFILRPMPSLLLASASDSGTPTIPTCPTDSSSSHRALTKHDSCLSEDTGPLDLSTTTRSRASGDVQVKNDIKRRASETGQQLPGEIHSGNQNIRNHNYPSSKLQTSSTHNRICDLLLSPKHQSGVYPSSNSVREKEIREKCLNDKIHKHLLHLDTAQKPPDETSVYSHKNEPCPKMSWQQSSASTYAQVTGVSPLSGEHDSHRSGRMVNFSILSNGNALPREQQLAGSSHDPAFQGFLAPNIGVMPVSETGSANAMNSRRSSTKTASSMSVADRPTPRQTQAVTFLRNVQSPVSSPAPIPLSSSLFTSPSQTVRPQWSEQISSIPSATVPLVFWTGIPVPPMPEASMTRPPFLPGPSVSLTEPSMIPMLAPHSSPALRDTHNTSKSPPELLQCPGLTHTPNGLGKSHDDVTEGQELRKVIHHTHAQASPIGNQKNVYPSLVVASLDATRNGRTRLVGKRDERTDVNGGLGREEEGGGEQWKREGGEGEMMAWLQQQTHRQQQLLTILREKRQQQQQQRRERRHRHRHDGGHKKQQGQRGQAATLVEGQSKQNR